MKFFDLHCDTAYECSTVLGGVTLDKGAGQLSLERGAYLDMWRQVFAVFMPDEFRGEAAREHYKKVRDYIYRQAELFPERFILCRSAEEIRNAGERGVCGAIMSVEGGSAAAGSLENIQSMYDDGVRLMTLTWNAANEIGSGVLAPEKGGLTPFGREAVALMNKLGMTVDVSHLSDEGFADVASLAGKPFVASHSCARSLCSNPRNLTDEMFCAIRDRGGLVGVNFYRFFLKDDGEADMYDILRHTEHFLALGGENTVCMGSDFDGAEMPAGVTGIEAMGEIYEMFLRHNYSESLAEKLFWSNANRFFSGILK